MDGLAPRITGPSTGFSQPADASDSVFDRMTPATEEELERQRERRGNKAGWKDGERKMEEDLSEEAKFWEEFETDEARVAKIKKTMPSQQEQAVGAQARS